MAAERPTRVRFIDARVVGTEGFRVGLGEDLALRRHVSADLTVRVMEAGTLEPGTRRFAATFALPAGMAPTHALGPAWAGVELLVQVSIPWWRDARGRFNLPLRIPGPASVERNPASARSERAPELRVDLASARVVAGETVAGWCSLAKHDDREPREVEMGLVAGFELRHGRRIRNASAAGDRFAVTIPAGGAGARVPFELAVPAKITPSFAAATQQLSWSLVATTGRLHAGRVGVELPLEVLDASAGT